MARQTKAERDAELAALAERERRDAESQQQDAEALEEELGRPPKADELAERREARKTAEADRALEEEMGGHGDDEGGGNGGASIEERAANGGAQVGEEDDGQMFVWEQGRKVSLGTLIPRGVDITHHFVFTGKRIKAKGELQALDARSLLLVQGLSGGTKAVPTHDADEKVESVAVESIVQTKTITAIESQPLEALALLRPVLERLGYDIVPRQEQAAG